MSAAYGDACCARPGQTRRDQVKSDRMRSSQVRSGQVRSCTPDAVCAPLSATLRTMHYVSVQIASTTLHVCEVRQDMTGQDPTRNMEVRSSGMGQVKSDQVRPSIHTHYVRVYTAS